MNRNAFGYYPLQLGGEHYLLDIARREQIVCAYLYSVESKAHGHPGAIGDRDRYALNLTALGEDPEDDWYDLPDGEIAANIGEALGQAEVEAGLEADRVAVNEGDLESADGFIDWALAGYRLAVALQGAHDGDRTSPAFERSIEAALAEYREATGADLSGARRPIPWAFGGPGEEEAA